MDYAYAVGRVRANEYTIPNEALFAALRSAPSYAAAAQLLRGIGWSLPAERAGLLPYLEQMELDCWQLQESCAPNAELLSALILPNDFFNLKAALKAVFSGLEPLDYLKKAAPTEPALVARCVKNKRLEELPAHLIPAAKQAYDALTRLGSGQQAELAIDREAIRELLRRARESGISALRLWAEHYAAAASVKTALRCARAGKEHDFIAAALADCPGLAAGKLAQAALEGKKSVAALLRSAGYTALAPAVEGGKPSALDDCLEELPASLTEGAKSVAFGPEPLLAFYLLKLQAIKRVRRILCAAG